MPTNEIHGDPRNTFHRRRPLSNKTRMLWGPGQYYSQDTEDYATPIGLNGLGVRLFKVGRMLYTYDTKPIVPGDHCGDHPGCGSGGGGGGGSTVALCDGTFSILRFDLSQFVKSVDATFVGNETGNPFVTTWIKAPASTGDCGQTTITCNVNIVVVDLLSGGGNVSVFAGSLLQLVNLRRTIGEAAATARRLPRVWGGLGCCGDCPPDGPDSGPGDGFNPGGCSER